MSSQFLAIVDRPSLFKNNKLEWKLSGQQIGTFILNNRHIILNNRAMKSPFSACHNRSGNQWR